MAGFCLGVGFSVAHARDLPRLSCDAREFRFGALGNTNDVTHTFVLANEGGAPLVIYRAQSDCGCTLVRLEDNIIHPGGQVAVRVRFILKGRSGPQHRRVTIESNDPDNPRLTLSLIGEAVAEVKIKPNRIYWGNLRSDASEVKTVDVGFDGSAPGHVTGAVASSPAFAVDLSTNKPGRAYRLRIRPLPPLAFGRFATTVRLTTDSSRCPRLTIPMQGRVVGDIYIVPDELRLSGAATQAVARLLMVKSSRKRNFKIVRVDPPLPDMEVSIRSSLFGGARIELRNLRPVPELNGRHLTVITDCETMRELTVPFRIGAP